MNMIMPRRPGCAELRSGDLGVRLAIGRAEIDAAQALRYDIFYNEMGARADAATVARRRDQDMFDEVAEHLVVLDHAASDMRAGIVATYRLIDAAAAARVGGFYSAGEFDIAALLATAGNVLELGRSCVHPRYRGGRAMQLMWRGLAAYVYARRIDVMFGCASLPGTDPDRIADQLTYLHHAHMAPAALRPRALSQHYVEMQRGDASALDVRRTTAALPPLIKGYLRLGGWVGDGAVIDAAFNTIDVAIVVRTDQVTERYMRHYEREFGDAEGYADRIGCGNPQPVCGRIAANIAATV